MALSTDQPDFLYAREAAPYCRVHRGTIYRWIEEGRIRATKVGGRWYVRRSDLDTFLGGDAA